MRVFPNWLLAILVALTGCSASPNAHDQSPAASTTNRTTDVWLLPMEGFPIEYISFLEKTFSSELGLKVRATVHTGQDARMYSPNGQIMAERIAQFLLPVCQRQSDVGPKTIFIVLTADDLNSEAGSLRFTFSAHLRAQPRISIVSTARMENSFFGLEPDPELTKTRLYKMVKKAIGIQFYEYPRSLDMKSVLYSPIMGVEDLDAIGTGF